jgi:EmrB/QacA subfamily drug resistance transporter
VRHGKPSDEKESCGESWEKDMLKNKNLTKWWIFGVTSMANLVVSFAINSLNLSLPTLAKEFGVSQGEVSWLALVYALIPCCTLLVFGRIADLYGYKRQFKIGFCVFALASFMAPLLSRNLLTLIVFRAFQGLGYSILISLTQATIARTFDETERGKAIGVNSVFVSVGLASGPIIGGFLLAHFSWHSIFYFCVPFCVFGLLATFVVMPEDEKRADRPKLDWRGGLLFAAAVGTLAVSLNFSDNWGFLSVPFAACIAVFALMLVLFIRHEKRAPAPLMPLSLFRSKTFTLANAACALSYITQQLTTYLFPFFLINVLLLTSDKSGMVLLASPIAMMVLSPVGGALTDRYGSRLPAAMGLLLIAVNSILVGFFKEDMSLLFVIPVLVMVGAGNGLSVPAINSAILGAAPRESSGVASGMLATMRNIGNTFGTAIGSVVLISRQAHYGSVAGLDKNQMYLFSQRDTFLVGFVLAAAAIVLVMRLPAKKPLT